MVFLNRSIRTFQVVLLLVLLSTGFVSGGQNREERIAITDVQRVIHKNWLGIPHKFDCTLSWELHRLQDDASWDRIDISDLDACRIVCRKDDGTWEEVLSTEINGAAATFEDLKVGVKYAFIVQGIRNGIRIAVSDTTRVLTGRTLNTAQTGGIGTWIRWIPFNGRFPMAVIGRGYVFDTSTKAGKIAFHLIWNFFIAGMVIMFFCFRYLRLQVVFPLKKGLYFGRGFEDIYQQGLSDDFRGIVKDWRNVVEDNNQHIRNGLEDGNQDCVAEIEAENVRFWRSRGTDAIRKLLDRLQPFRQYPSARIVQAGLEKHELGGFRWLQVSREVDRSIENRASSELEQLRRNSHMDWLWNLGTLAPLLGLFGTATGISFVFATLTMLRTDVTQNVLVRRLSGGIFEALWTTIEGLFVGIILMLVYYYYQNKLNWIYSKWEEMYVRISEKM